MLVNLVMIRSLKLHYLLGPCTYNLYFQNITEQMYGYRKNARYKLYIYITVQSRLIMEGLEIKKLQTIERAYIQSCYEIDPCWANILKIQGT